jgi:uncharacterized protein YqeY
MTMRDTLNQELKLAMKSGNKRRVDTIRMINAAVKDKEIEARGLGKTIAEDDILAVLQKMVKSRTESLTIYEKAGREDLASQERDEIAIIATFLPTPLSIEQVDAAIIAAIEETGASSMKDMGKVIAILRAKFAGQMDFAAVSGLLKTKLG